ncbi:MAG: hypothetical protein JNL19_16270 [Burkholderiales bacterium]|nr:hypothetical protein [Burkholderiales bacterium]
MLEVLITTLDSIGQHGLTLALRERLQSEQQTKLGAEHQETLATASNLVRAYLDAGQTLKALSLGERVLASRVNKLGMTHKDSLDSRNLLAIVRRQASNEINSSVNSNPIGEAQTIEQELSVKKLLLANRKPMSPYYGYGDVRREVQDTKIPPFSSVVAIEIHAGAEISVCSGAAVVSPRVVATAAHCIAGKGSVRIFVKVVDGLGNLSDQASATVFATGSKRYLALLEKGANGKRLLDSGTLTLGDLGVSELYAPQRNSTPSEARISAFANTQDWAVLLLDRPLNGLVPLQPMLSQNDYFKYKGGYAGLIAVGFPGDWIASRMVVAPCPLPQTGSATPQSIVGKNGMDMYYMYASRTKDGCVLFNGASGGPLMLFDKVSEKFLFAGIYSGVFSRSTRVDTTVAHIRDQQPLNFRSVKSFDGFNDWEFSEFAYGTNLLRALYSASGQVEPPSVHLSRGLVDID